MTHEPIRTLRRKTYCFGHRTFSSHELPQEMACETCHLTIEFHKIPKEKKERRKEEGDGKKKPGDGGQTSSVTLLDEHASLRNHQSPPLLPSML